MKCTALKSAAVGRAVCALALIGIPAGAAAQKTGERPPHAVEEVFANALAYMQEKGEIQLNSIMRFEGPKGARAASIPLEFEYGITDDIEVSLETAGLLYLQGDGWETEKEFGVGVRYGRYGGPLSKLHWALGFEVESEPGEAPGEERVTTFAPGLALGTDLGRFRWTHLFTSLTAALPSGDEDETRWNWGAGAIVPFGQLRATVEVPLVAPEGAERPVIPGLIWRSSFGFELGAATAIETRSPARARGLRLSVLFEF